MAFVPNKDSSMKRACEIHPRNVPQMTSAISAMRPSHGEQSSNIGVVDFSNEDNEMHTRTQEGRTMIKKQLNISPENVNIGELPCHLFYLDSNQILQRFHSLDQLSDYLVSAALDRTFTSTELKRVCNKLLQTPLVTANHYASVGEYLRYLYENDRLMDVLIDVRGKMFSAHRVALCCHSDYFADLFLGKKITKLPFELKVNGVSPGAFATFLEFCYTGNINVTPEIATEVLIVVDFLKVGTLKRRLGVVYENIPLDQALKLLMMSKNTSGELYTTMLLKVLNNFPEVSRTKEFLEMNASLFCYFLSSDKLVINSEYELFVATMRWLLHDIDSRAKYTTNIVKLIRFFNMSCLELVQCVETSSLFRDHHLFREAVLIAQWLQTCYAVNREDPFRFHKPALRQYGVHVENLLRNHGNPLSPNTYPMADHNADKVARNQFSTIPHKLFQPKYLNQDDLYEQNTGFDKEFSELVQVERGVYAGAIEPRSVEEKTDLTKIKTTTPLEKSKDLENLVMPPPLMTSTPRSRMVSPNVVDEDVADILVIGGFLGEEPTEKTGSKFVERYDTADNQWVHFCKLPVMRSHHTVVTSGDYIYLIGGTEPPSPAKRPTPSKTAYRMNVMTKEWNAVANMKEARYRHCACTKDGFIIVLGGKGLVDFNLRSVECYDNEADEWFYLTTLDTPRFGAMATCVGERIFIAGGIGDNQDDPASFHVLNSVACYHLPTNSWSNISNLRIPRCLGQLVNMKGRLFICGGATRSYDYESSVLNSMASIDEYDFEKNEWVHVTNMQTPRHDMGVAVVGSRMYMIGGVSSIRDEDLQSVDCFDAMSGEWLTNIQQLPNPSKWTCCTVVRPKFGMRK